MYDVAQVQRLNILGSQAEKKESLDLFKTCSRVNRNIAFQPENPTLAIVDLERKGCLDNIAWEEIFPAFGPFGKYLKRPWE